jgi:hypothetical protein
MSLTPSHAKDDEHCSEFSVVEQRLRQTQCPRQGFVVDGKVVADTRSLKEAIVGVIDSVGVPFVNIGRQKRVYITKTTLYGTLAGLFLVIVGKSKISVFPRSLWRSCCVNIYVGRNRKLNTIGYDAMLNSYPVLTVDVGDAVVEMRVTVMEQAHVPFVYAHTITHRMLDVWTVHAKCFFAMIAPKTCVMAQVDSSGRWRCEGPGGCRRVFYGQRAWLNHFGVSFLFKTDLKWNTVFFEGGKAYFRRCKNNDPSTCVGPPSGPSRTHVSRSLMVWPRHLPAPVVDMVAFRLLCDRLEDWSRELRIIPRDEEGDIFWHPKDLPSDPEPKFRVGCDACRRNHATCVYCK